MAIALPGALPGRVQVAGVIDQRDADLIVESGADMLGFPLGLGDEREEVDVDTAAAIIDGTSARVTSVCITYLDSAREVFALCERLRTRWVQLHGPIEVAEIRTLKANDPSLGIIKSLIVRPGRPLLDDIGKFEPYVDAFITDTYDPDTGRTGATGKTHDWRVSRDVVQATKRPVILAGGLTPENVSEGIEMVRPAAVDAHTGVEGPDGRKNAVAVTAFVGRAREAFSKHKENI